MTAKWVLFKTVQREPGNKLACQDRQEQGRGPAQRVRRGVAAFGVKDG